MATLSVRTKFSSAFLFFCVFLMLLLGVLCTGAEEADVEYQEVFSYTDEVDEDDRNISSRRSPYDRKYRSQPIYAGGNDDYGGLQAQFNKKLKEKYYGDNERSKSISPSNIVVETMLVKKKPVQEKSLLSKLKASVLRLYMILSKFRSAIVFSALLASGLWWVIAYYHSLPAAGTAPYRPL